VEKEEDVVVVVAGGGCEVEDGSRFSDDVILVMRVIVVVPSCCRNLVPLESRNWQNLGHYLSTQRCTPATVEWKLGETHP
jgi:hypothetical protein